MFGLKEFYTQNKVTPVYIILFPFLLLLSGIYGLVLMLRRLFYEQMVFCSYRPKAKVVSIGNIVLGGSGKTPLVEYAASYLANKGKKTAIVLRGYKKPLQRGKIGSDRYYAQGDEASMLEENCGKSVAVVAGTNRVNSVRRLEEAQSLDVLILDDGFQHWALRRDLDIVVLDATNPFGNGFLLPAGHLRECRGSLTRAHVFCLTRCLEAGEAKTAALENFLKSLKASALVIRAVHRPKYFYDLRTNEKQGLEIVKNTAVAALCGIANPVSFIRTLEGLGAVVVAKHIYQDHYSYQEKELETIFGQCRNNGLTTLITTQKDAQRIVGFVRTQNFRCAILGLRVGLEITKGQEALHDRLDSLYMA